MFQLEQCIEQQLREVEGPVPTLILPEGDDPRVLSAASRMIQFSKVVVLRSQEDVERDLEQQQVPLGVTRKRFLQSVQFIVPEQFPDLLEEFAAKLVELGAGRSWGTELEQAKQQVLDPVYFAILAVRQGYADAVLGGVTHSSRDFFKPCLRLLERDGTVYEMGLFALPDEHDVGFFKQNLVMFADVALNPEPSSERLADIAVGACATLRNIIPKSFLPEINGAILSYSTRGSGAGASVERIRNAEPLIEDKLEQLARQNPAYRSIHIVTELQVSCAISKEAARTKLGEAADLNPAVGASNVLIAPSLDTGNLLYHMYATRFADAQSVLVIGGLRNQALDFSRSSDADDIVLGAKTLVLRMYRSGRFKRTPKDRFFIRYKILTINPVAAYTELALWEGRELAGRKRIKHSEQEMATPLLEQMSFRRSAVETFLKEQGVVAGDLDAVVGRGGLVLPVESGTYRVDQRMINHLRQARSGEHAVNLGALLAHEIADTCCENVFVVDPVVVDELDETSRLTGLAEFDQEAAWHALAQKAVGKMHAVKRGYEYEDLRLIIAHLGSGISIGAHLHGRCIKVRNALFDGPFSPERAGSLPGRDLIEFCFSGATKEEVVRRLTRDGGLMSYLGTTDLKEVERRMNEGDAQAQMAFAAMVEQIAAEIASLVPKFGGKLVDRILLTGSLTHSQMLVSWLETALGALQIGITVYPGDREVESLRDGAMRVLRGIEPALEYRPLRSRL